MPVGRRQPRSELLACLGLAALRGAAAANSSGGRLRLCSGFEEEHGLCDDLPPCDECKPQDCEFHDWSDWEDYGGCSGLLVRNRGIKTVNNDCGHPCTGPKQETIRHLKDRCVETPVDCEVSDWSEWSKCNNPTDQRFRSRKVDKLPEYGGKACDEELRQTAPCGAARPPLDCDFSTWQEWTSCSVTCGQGRRTRERRVAVKALFGGLACKGATLMTAVCEEKACESKDCEMGDWSDWSVCDEQHRQKYRSRSVVHPASGDGERCDDSLRETAACPEPETQNCEYSEWSDWSKCDAECDGGQSFRKRKLANSMSAGGNCTAANTEETKACNNDPCTKPPQDCLFSQWEDWGPCDVDCGNGSSTRIRSIVHLAEEGGQGCTGPLDELRQCESEEACVNVDCKWGDWGEWSGCTCDCDGGTKRRNRIVVRAPLGTGKQCDPLDKSEVAACNTQPCAVVCNDGLWEDWGAWSQCSASCDGGYRSRHRGVAQMPTSCGKPLEGHADDFAPCEDSPPCAQDHDCELSEWGEWSDCSCSCYGLKERSRVIKTFVSGKGKPCVNETMKELVSCNPTPGGEGVGVECGHEPHRDCQWDSWGEWGECSRTCGGGQRTLSRKILHHATGGGVPCEGSEEVIGPCNEESCEKRECIDCEMGEWGDWEECRSAQRLRHRSITALPNICGKLCDDSTLMQIENCSMPEEDSLVCGWTDWSDAVGCSKGCGPLSATRNRVLGFQRVEAKDAHKGDSNFFGVDPTSSCTGTQLDLVSCDRDPCTPQCEPKDCRWQAWSDWGPATCDGLCSRHREIREHSNDCGDPCHGPIIETKKCLENCTNPVPCLFNDWSEWTSCMSPLGQKSKSRTVKQQAERDGDPCRGPLVVTAPCSTPRKASDCLLGKWTAWDDCPVTCGGATQRRKRDIVQSATAGGAMCDGKLEEFQACGMDPCTVDSQDCELSEWSHWHGCGADGQKYRDRHVVHAAIGKGRPCDGHLEETQTCLEEPRDCVMSDWTGWGDCDKTCGGGQQSRSRQIQVFPKNGGKACGSALIETKGCNDKACDYQDCDVSHWSEWDACSASCGIGQHSRARKFLHMREDGGIGCSQHLAETEGCNAGDCEIRDCKWRDWEEWSDCSCSCGGGHRTRERHIDVFPKGGGKECDVSAKEAVEPCNTQACDEECIDGEWGDWTEWLHCSASCGGGLTSRTRVVKKMANHCGKPPEGMDREERFCNRDVPCQKAKDCEFRDWGDWGACTQECDGTMQRSRSILEFGAGLGKFCEGSLREISPCHPAPGKEEPAACKKDAPQDCQLTHWSKWSNCSAVCGGGQRERSREIFELSKDGGKACEGPLHEVEECNRHACAGPKKVDCELGDWMDWAPCTKCGLQRKRFREIKQHPLNGGDPCPTASLEDIGACPQKCLDDVYCEWRGWGDWSECSATCGKAVRTRRRHVGETKSMPKQQLASISEVMAKYEALQEHTSRLESSHVQELALAFGCGGFSLLLGLSAWRFLAAHRQASSSMRASMLPTDRSGGASSRFDRLPREATLDEVEMPLTGRHC